MRKKAAKRMNRTSPDARFAGRVPRSQVSSPVPGLLWSMGPLFLVMIRSDHSDGPPRWLEQRRWSIEVAETTGAGPPARKFPGKSVGDLPAFDSYLGE